MSEKMNENKFVCIMCPLGCEVTVMSDDSGQITEVLGNKCSKGEKYVEAEFSHPVRALTSTVAIEGAQFARLPVRTTDVVPKDTIFDCMREIQKVKVKSPIKKGAKVIENLLNMKVDVVATRDL